MRLPVLPACALLLFATSCAGTPFVGRPGLTVVSATEMPPPVPRGPGSETSFLIGPYDRLSVDVFGLPEASRTVQVDPAGRISVPLAGELTASGKTTSEVARDLQQRLRAAHMRDPRVTVAVAEVVSQLITVDGEVHTPGQYPVVGRLTLMRAIARAQGVTEFASQNHVVVFRTVDNQQMAALYDLRAIRQGMYADPEVYSNDVILVGESQSRRIFQNIIQSSGLISAPLIALLSRN